MNKHIEQIFLNTNIKWVWYSIYWLLAATLLFFVFNNQQYDVNIRILVVSSLTLMSIGLTLFINNYLIPKFLFKGKILLFGYLMVASFILSIWINILCIVYILWHTAYYFRDVMLPTKTDLILLISGSYIIILFAAFVHFIKETYSRQMERDRFARQKAETELKLQEARLKLLQGQLHPHFLFNMLNNLYGLWMEKSNATPDVILKLSALLDYMLYNCDKEKVTLRDEIQFIRNYIDLETIRHDSRLKLDINLPDCKNNQMIAPLILFAFVENAFKHAANKNTGETYISISLNSSAKGIDFKVINNYTPNEETSVGIGFKNVEERLNLIYGNRYKLNIEKNNNHFKVWLSLETE
jgi:sensor histidine kinase YesM